MKGIVFKKTCAWMLLGSLICLGGAAFSAPEQPRRAASATPQPVQTGAALPRPREATGTATPAARGRIEETSLRSPLLALPMEVLVYLPPGYERETDRRYPVLYLIHGQNFTEDQWDRIGADETADRLISSGEVNPFLIVMPHDRLWTNPDESPFDDVFLDVLVPWVDATYRTQAERGGRAVGGLSRGGAWAVYLGISAWQQFGVIGVHSGFYFQGTEYLTRRRLQAIPAESLPRMFIDIGSGDHLLSANDMLEEMLLLNNIPHEYYLYPGRHEEAYWSSHVEQYLRWYAADW